MTAARSSIADKNRLLTLVLAFVFHHSISGCKEIIENESLLNLEEANYFKTPT